MADEKANNLKVGYSLAHYRILEKIGAGGTGGGAHTTLEWYSAEGRDLGLKRVLLTLGLLLQESADD